MKLWNAFKTVLSAGVLVLALWAALWVILLAAQAPLE